MKAIILAAGHNQNLREDAAETPWLLRALGDRAILDYVVDLGRHAVGADNLLIVIDQRGNQVEQHLGDGYRYVEQRQPLGTGHAVLQAHPYLKDHTGSLLILHGDSPFFRRSSVLGMIQRHCLKNSCLTLLTGLTERVLRSGWVLRGQDGQIVDIIDNADTAPVPQANFEVNTGSYVVKASLLWPALQQLLAEKKGQQSGEVRLTDCMRRLVRGGCTVDNYLVLDADELLDINSAADLDDAALILQKRQLRPRRMEEHNIIHFGTGGWRALIGEGFTLDNVRRLCQSLANDIMRHDREQDGVLIGYDRRFLGESSAHAAAEVFAGNGIAVQLLSEPAPTPLVTYGTALNQFAYGLIFTASHNPPEWNGLKVFATDGSLPLDEQIRTIEEEANLITPDHVVKVDLELAQHAGLVEFVDYTNAYVDAVEALIDLRAIRAAKLRVVVDPMHGVGQNALEIILTEARCRVDTINTRHDPLFGGRSPAPDSGSLTLLTNTLVEGGYHLGLAMDGDADRIAIIDKQGAYISTNELLVLLYYYLHQIRKESGGVTRNLATTHLLDRLASHFGEPVYEVPVGFKHLAASMIQHDVLLAGESSGGLSIRGHILGKDGIFACALVVEMMARTGLSISEMLANIYEITGVLVSRELNLPASPDMKVIVPRRLREFQPNDIHGMVVKRISHQDGVKFYLENDAWLLLRFSGTEPLLRLFAEAETAQQADVLIDWARSFVQV